MKYSGKGTAIMTEIEKRLFELQDEKYRDFQVKLIPTVDPSAVIGVSHLSLISVSLPPTNWNLQC